MRTYRTVMAVPDVSVMPTDLEGVEFVTGPEIMARVNELAAQGWRVAALSVPMTGTGEFAPVVLMEQAPAGVTLTLA